MLRQLVSQFHRPHGLGGLLAGWVMSYRSSNRRRNHWVVSLIDVQPTDRILEIGFGPGIAIQDMARTATRGVIYGIDHSEVMLGQASRRNSAAIRAGRVDLRCSSVEDLPTFEGFLDKVLAVNSMGFWRDKATSLAALGSVLRPGGQIAVVSQPRCRGATAETSEHAAAEIEASLKQAGFSISRIETLPLEPPVVCVLGNKPES